MKKFLLLLLIVTVFECKRKEESSGKEHSDFYAVSIFSSGKILRSNQEFKTKSVLQLNEELLLLPKSICDLQISKQDWTMRIYGEANFKLAHSMKKDSAEDWVLHLQEGTLFAKISQKLKEKETFRVITPTSVVAVRGTQFKIEVSKEGNTTVSVIEGKVAVQLTPNPASLKNYSEVVSLIEKSEIYLEKEKSLNLNQEFWKSIEAIPLDQKENFSEKFSKISIKSTSIIKQDIKAEMEKEFTAISSLPLTAFNDEVTLNNSIETRIKEKSPELLLLMEKSSKKKIGTITLTSGEEIRGIIDKNEKNIIVETPLKTIQLQESEVMELVYE